MDGPFTNTSTTTNLPTLNELAQISREWRQKEDERIAKFNESAKADPCYLCGHVMRADGPRIFVCVHQFHAVRRKCNREARVTEFGIQHLSGIELCVEESPNRSDGQE